MALEDLKLNDETSGDLGGYFHVTITDLDLATQYPLQFQYIYADKRLNDNWSAVKYFTTVGATIPNEPQLQTTDVVGGAGFIKVAWSGNDAGGSPVANFDRVDVHISGTTFGDGTKAAGSFKSSGTQTFTCVAGVYIVQLKVYSLNGESSFFSTARTVTVTAVGEAIDTPVSPSSGGFSSRRILGGLEVSWDGTYGSSWSGFSAINIYAGTSSSATSGTYIKVGQMTANRVTNKIVVPVDGTYVRYGEPVYIHASSVNKNDVESSIVANVTSQSSGAARATDSDINDGAVSFAKLAANTLTVDNLSAGTISSTAFIRAGTAGSARVEMSSASISGGPAAGFYIYNSAGTAVLSAPLSGGLSIVGGGTFSGALSAATGTFTGTLSAATGSFSGTITASGGTIGGVIIASDAIQNGSTSGNSTFRLDSTGKARFGTSNGNALILNPSPSTGGYYIYHSSNGGTAASGKFSVSDGGILTATGATFSGTITNSTSSDYWNNDGTFRFGGSNGITYNGTTISMGSIVSMPAAQITGTITANAIVSNATITSPTIAGGIFRTASSGQRIVINETTNQIDIYPDSSSSPGYISASTVLSAGSLKLASPYASGYAQSNIQLYSLGSSTSYVQLNANLTQVVGGLSVTAGSLFSGDAEFVSNIVATGAVNAATLTPAPNTYITTGGQIRRTSGSSIRYKKDIVDLLTVEDLNPNKLYSLPVRAFKYKEEFTSSDDSRYNKLLPGFIAEEVEEIYSIAADYDINGVEKWNSNIMIPAMLALIQDLNTRLDALEA